MLVLSPDLVLTEGGPDDPRLPLIGWRSVVSVTTMTSSTAAAGFPVTNLANPDTSLGWVAAAAGAERLIVTPGNADDLDYIGVAGQSFARAGIALTVECKFSPADPGWTVLVPQMLPANDAPAMFRLPRQPYYQVSLALAAGTEAAAAAVLYAGALTALDPGIEIGFTPLPLGRQSEVYVGRSVGGHYLGEIEASSFLQSSITVANMDPAWFRAELDPMLQARPRRAFFHAWDPVGHPFETGYAWLTGSPRPLIDKKNRRMSIALPMAGIAS